MTEINEDQIPKEKGIIESIADGDLGLAMTYWVYGVLGGICLHSRYNFSLTSLRRHNGIDNVATYYLLHSCLYRYLECSH